MNLFSDLIHRLRRSLAWVAAQYWATLLIVLAAIAWTRLPDRHAWQVGLTLLVPCVLIAATLALDAATIRSFTSTGENRVRFFWGALTLLAWVALGCAVWFVLDWCDDQTFEWAGYLNSRFSASGRATVFTFDHIQHWITRLIWIARWILLPGKLIPYAVASAQWGWRLPIRKILRLLFNWRWWLAVVVAALIGVALTGHFFAGLPSGTVSHQVWAVILKLIGAYLLAVSCWVLLLCLAAVLLARGKPAAEQPAGEPPGTEPVNPELPHENSAPSVLPETGNHAAGNA
jgi:hypothetical protein